MHHNKDFEANKINEQALKKTINTMHLLSSVNQWNSIKQKIIIIELVASRSSGFVPKYCLL